jgi:hypothetical protein
MTELNKKERKYIFHGLGTAITIDLWEGHTVFASAKYDHDGQNYNVVMAVCKTPEMRNEREVESLPLYNVFLTDLKVTAQRNNIKGVLVNTILKMFHSGQIDHAISEIDTINKVLEHSESLIDSLNFGELGSE